MSVVVRFSPSPTGFLHIGGARTALFNWLFARHHGGKFHLRVEDTDRERSTEAATAAILDGLRWLGIDWDDDVVYQHTRQAQHVQVAQQLLAEGKAYYCYTTPQELEAMRAEAAARGERFRYDRRWREHDGKDVPKDVPPVVRLKAPLDGEVMIEDRIQGAVQIDCRELDDMVLLRSDGTPTYMLAVVVDDHDMGITHVIRGDDHLTNTFRQQMLYDALGWQAPVWAHMSLIHGSDGAKLSKRHGALGVEAYREMGYLPEAVCNYLLRLGWSHGNEEIITREQAIGWFDIDGINKAPARLDMQKLASVNAHYLRQTSPDVLVQLLQERGLKLTQTQRVRTLAGIALLTARAKTLVELQDAVAPFLAERPVTCNEAARAALSTEARAHLRSVWAELQDTPWDAASINSAIKAYLQQHHLKMPQVGVPLRAALFGSVHSPSIAEMMVILGKDECLARLADVAGQ